MNCDKENFLMSDVICSEVLSVVVEGCVIARSKNLKTAMAIVFASYYVFNIAYPKKLLGVMTFIQKDILQINDKAAKVSKVLTLMSNHRH